MSQLKLTQIRGIGKVVSEKMIHHFRSESNAVQAIKAMNLSELAKVDGLGQNGAVRIIRAAHNVLTGENLDSLLRSSDVQMIYENLLKIFQSYCWTSYAKSKCYIDLLPLPQEHFDSLKKRQNLFKTYYDFYINTIPQTSSFQSSFHQYFQEIQPLKSKGARFDLSERVICTTLPEVKTTLEQLKFDQIFKIDLINSFEDLKQKVEEGKLVILVSEEEFASIEPNTFILANDNAIKKPWSEFVPERSLNFFAQNKKSILSMINVLQLLNQEISLQDKYSDLIPDIWSPKLEGKLSTLKNLLTWLEQNGNINEKYDSELERLTFILNNFTDITDGKIDKLNDELRLAIETENIQLSGKKFLELLQTSGDGIMLTNLDEYIDNTIFDLVENLAIKTEKEIIKSLQLMPEEYDRLEENLVSRELSFPIRVNSELVNDFLQYIRMKQKNYSFLIKRKFAYTLESERDWIEQIMQSIMDLDFICMMGRVSVDLNLKWPKILNENTGASFFNAKNLFLVNEFRKNDKTVEPVTYEFGKIAYENQERITILSGANSGGKTTLLSLIAQISLLAHMGLGVPAERAEIGIFSEIYYYKKPTGDVNAGAFETTLKLFSKMLTNQKDKLVLADEMEAISEPDASAKVISTILELLARQTNTCGVFVSHLADQLRAELTKAIRIDGIEASGLDEFSQLIVDRTPKINYHARSTPQLIVERLLRSVKENSPEMIVYKSIKDKFD
ncbi:MAG: MutS-related protein [Candidatus Hodarchaeales archaeon]|jgi:hypothetical protein